MTPLEKYPKIREILYDVQWVVNLLLLIIAFVLTTLGQSPLWFVILSGVFNIIWTYTGLTAKANVDDGITAYGELEHDDGPAWEDVGDVEDEIDDDHPELELELGKE